MTQLRVAAGGAHYLAVMRDCAGESIGESSGTSYDVGVGVDHKFGGQPMALGVNASYLRDDALEGDIVRGRREYYVVNPVYTVMTKRFSISVGAAYFSKQLLNPNDVNAEFNSKWLPTVATRIGDLQGFYLTASFLSGLPTYSGAGYFDLGGGWTLSDDATLWAGANLSGLTATGIEARLQWRLGDRFYSDVGASLGGREGETQYSANVGLTYRVVH